MGNDAIIAVVLFAAATFAALVSLSAEAMTRDDSRFGLVAWRRALFPMPGFFCGPLASKLQAVAIRFATLVLYMASGFFALSAAFKALDALISK